MYALAHSAWVVWNWISRQRRKITICMVFFYSVCFSCAVNWSCIQFDIRIKYRFLVTFAWDLLYCHGLNLLWEQVQYQNHHHHIVLSLFKLFVVLFRLLNRNSSRMPRDWSLEVIVIEFTKCIKLCTLHNCNGIIMKRCWRYK